MHLHERKFSSVLKVQWAGLIIPGWAKGGFADFQSHEDLSLFLRYLHPAQIQSEKHVAAWAHSGFLHSISETLNLMAFLEWKKSG